MALRNGLGMEDSEFMLPKGNTHIVIAELVSDQFGAILSAQTGGEVMPLQGDAVLFGKTEHCPGEARCIPSLGLQRFPALIDRDQTARSCRKLDLNHPRKEFLAPDTIRRIRFRRRARTPCLQDRFRGNAEQLTDLRNRVIDVLFRVRWIEAVTRDASSEKGRQLMNTLFLDHAGDQFLLLLRAEIGELRFQISN